MTTVSRRIPRRVAALAAGTALGALLVASPAAAHVHPDLETVAAGEETTVSLVVGHGCDGAATERVEIQVPESVTTFTTGEIDGWTGSIDGRVITYEGGPLPDETELGFPVVFTAPGEAQTLRFPIIQYCGDTESAWISDDPEADNPAPFLEVTGSAPTETTVAETTTTAADVGADTTTTEATAGGAAPTTTDGSAADTSDMADEEDDDDSSPVVPIVIGAIVILALAGGGIAYARSRSNAGNAE